MQKHLAMVLAILATLFFLTPAVMADYDSAKVKANMKQVVQNLKDLQAKAAAKDYYGTAEKFMEIAKIYKALEAVTPAKGTKAEWDRNHNALIDAAFKGIGACGAQDDEAIKQAVKSLVQYRDAGHKVFK